MSAGRSIPFQILAWSAIAGFWCFMSRQNHPTTILNLFATSLLVATFALAVYVNHLLLIPIFLRRGFFPAYLAGLACVTILLSLMCTLLIGVVYDVLWGPDPRRFGFGTNFAMEFSGVFLHVAVVASGVRLWKEFRRDRSGVASKLDQPHSR